MKSNPFARFEGNPPLMECAFCIVGRAWNSRKWALRMTTCKEVLSWLPACHYRAVRLVQVCLHGFSCPGLGRDGVSGCLSCPSLGRDGVSSCFSGVAVW